MSTDTGTEIIQGFSKPGVHSLTYKDDFYPQALLVREELLHYPDWKEMTQEGLGTGRILVPHRQNGITTGHLYAEDSERLPLCNGFREFLSRNLAALLPQVGVIPTDPVQVEINAMAYGAGAWLSPHTDFFEYSLAQNRLAAWMLYLTAPEDGEWPLEKGGAVRVWIPGEEGIRISPRFNRFAMFQVSDRSFHEIEKIMWQPEWPNCRLALSGWFLGPRVTPVSCHACMYVRSSSASEKKSEAEKRLQGSLALHRLLAKQKDYCGINASKSWGRIAILEREYQAHTEAPAGTHFLGRVPGPAGCIIVVNEAGDVLHFGTLEAYRQKLKD